MNHIVLFVLFICLMPTPGGSVYAGEFNYAANAIPAGLKTNASAVFRSSHTQVKIVSASEIIMITSYIVTILNEKGAHYGWLKEAHDKYVNVEDVSGTLYDSQGDRLKKMKKYDIKEISPFSDNFMDDIKYKVYDFDCKTYPYTCEFEIEKSINNLTDLPVWSPQEGYDCSVEHADIEITYPKDFPIRYRGFHIGELATPVFSGDEYMFRASVSDLAAAEKPDNFAVAGQCYVPTIIFAADNYVLEEHEGNVATWQGFGKFFYDLNDHRDELPDSLRKTVHRLTDTCSTPMNKIAILYEYLKKNTRYISIQLGVGGWQAFDAKFVAEKRYGDCKALSNFMKSLLKEAGITAYEVIAYAGEDERNQMILDFPSKTFNHMIVCVPLKNDTTWLECTSKTLPAGYLSAATEDRFVLMLTPGGGYPVKTPANSLENNSMTRLANIDVSGNDELKGILRLRYSGYFWEKEQHNVVNETKSKVDNYLNEKMKLGSYAIGDYKITNNKNGHVPCLDEVIPVSGEGNISRSGQKLFLSPRIFPLHISAPALTSVRKNPFQLNHSQQITDTIVFNFPATYTIEGLHESKLELAFGSYRYSAAMTSSNTLTVIINFKLKAGIYPPEQFADYIRLYKQINTDDDTRLVLNKAE